eukprot:TRINITY_DN74766_c0_g1_i1.p1 TRINITY_DN74766_c0_g1~~TRINITY_DN74766_c0_g1_i1.p1  ORF type:complete len:620 (+),score=111.23 TRINITY_DN74766_c0_g1_i1:84-1943(+)
MAGFSSGVKLGDLDDFISLSQECVIPLLEAAGGGGGKAKLDATVDGPTGQVATVEVPQVQIKKPDLIKSKQSKEDPKAQIGQVSLSDCLACSGCVTSAETVLLQEQSGEEFIKRAMEAPLTVVSISPEARTSLANSLGMAPLDMMRRVAEVLRRFGVKYVVETSAAEAIALLEAKKEFVRRFQASQSRVRQSHPLLSLPLVTSNCPGWTLYAEKVVDPVVLPNLAPLRPPQHIQGRLVKTCLLDNHNRRRFQRWWRSSSPLFAAESWPLGFTPEASSASSSSRPQKAYKALSPKDVYHISVQPCFDRKIEAARPLFVVGGAPGSDTAVQEVDTVLATTELLELIQGAAGGVVPEISAGADAKDILNAVKPIPLTGEALTDLWLGDLVSNRPQPLLCGVQDHAGSGGFLEHVFKEAAYDLFRLQVPSPLQFKTKQNADMREVVLEDPKTKRALLKFVSCYGFRNIQNVVRKLTKADASGVSKAAAVNGKSVEPPCGHFVEVMACPGGCLNGGGQIPIPKKENRDGAQAQADREERLAAMDALLRRGEGIAFLKPAEHPDVLPLYRYMTAASAEGRSVNQWNDLDAYVGSVAVNQWLSAGWRSLKVDAEGNEVVTSSALRW